MAEAVIDTHTALLVIDMQYGDAHPDFGLLKERRERGDDVAYYTQRLEQDVVPNIARLQESFRAAGLEVIHVGIQSMTRDGRDRGLLHKKRGIHQPPGSKDAEFRAEVAPRGDELVFYKTCAGAFGGTNIEYVLRNMEIQRLVVTGVITGSCVEATVRGAADLGFEVILAEDATTTWSPELQAAAVRSMNGRSATVLPTRELLLRLPSGAAATRT